MDFFVKILFILFLLGGGSLILWLSENKKYVNSNKWYKSLIATVASFFAMNYLPTALLYIFGFSSNYLDYSGNVIDFSYFVVNAIGIIGSIVVGMYVYYSLCNKTKSGQIIGYILYTFYSVTCFLGVYSLLVYENKIFDAGLYVVAIAAGLVSVFKLHKFD